MLPWLAAPVSAQPAVDALDPAIRKIVDSVSEERIAAHMRRLETFETRNTLTPSRGPNHGIAAARQWLYEEFKSYSPRL